LRLDFASSQLGPKLSPVSAVSLPGAFPLFATGFGALGLLGWRSKRTTAARKYRYHVHYF
jgi:hypothetical protein